MKTLTPKEWTIASLKEHYDMRFIELDARVSRDIAAADKSVERAFASSEKAISKAEEAQTAYNVRSNEFRDALNDSIKANIRREEVTTLMTGMVDKIEDLKAVFDSYKDSQTKVLDAYKDSQLKIFDAYKESQQKDMNVLSEYKVSQTGQAHGAYTVWLAVLAVCGLLGTIGGFAIALTRNG